MVEGRRGENVGYLGDGHLSSRDRLFPPLDSLKQAKAGFALLLVVAGQVTDENVGVDELHAFLSLLASRWARSSLAMLTISLSIMGRASGRTERYAVSRVNRAGTSLTSPSSMAKATLPRSCSASMRRTQAGTVSCPI